MRSLLPVLLVLSLAGPTAAAELKMARTPSSLDVSGHEKQMAMLSPSLRSWVTTQARATLDSGVDPDPNLIARDAQTRLAGQDFSSSDIEAMVQLVMMECARQADADLREAMAEMRAANEHKAAMRERAKAQREDAKAASKSAGAEIVGPEASAICVDPPCQPQIILAQPRLELANAGAAAGQALPPDAELDSMSEIGEMTSLRLQMYMDRRAKAFEALSNLMKKQSDTSSTIISNLK